MEIFSVDEDKKQLVLKWVLAKGGKPLEELVNLYLNEMVGRI